MDLGRATTRGPILPNFSSVRARERANFNGQASPSTFTGSHIICISTWKIDAACDREPALMDTSEPGALIPSLTPPLPRPRIYIARDVGV